MTYQMICRHEIAIHYYIQQLEKTSSKHNEKKFDWTLGEIK